MRRLLALVPAGLLLAGSAAAHAPNEPPHQTHCMGDLRLESGESIRDFCISYVTHGTLNASRSNAVSGGFSAVCRCSGGMKGSIS